MPPRPAKLEDKVRALERMLGRKTMETEILREALDQARAKKQTWHLPSPPRGGSPSRDHAAHDPAGQRVNRVAEVLEVSRSQLHVRVSGASKSRGAYSKAADAELLPSIRRLVDQRPTYGYRRLTALLDRERRDLGLEPINRKRVARASSASTA